MNSVRRLAVPASPPHPADRRSGRALGLSLLVLAAALVTNSALGPLGIDVLAYPLSDSLLNQLLGLELVTLLLVVPAIVTAAVLSLHARPGAPALAVGPTGCTAYMFVQYVVGPARLTYSPTILLHLTIATLAGATCVWSWRRAVAVTPPWSAGRIQPARIAWLLVLAAFVVTRYLPVLAGAVSGRSIPAEYAEAPAFYWTIVLLDLGVVVPATVAAAVAVGLGRPSAGPAWISVVSWFTLVSIAVAAMAAVMIVRRDPNASVATLAITSIASVAFAVPAVRASRRILREGQAGS
ncbi:hypothetical protein [Nocardioides sp. L-11A]|uniref:hypothetical protein n=1 Tax=Nocardioides sp. L-11A TaxID=3043848 RepID=UPI00249CE4DD|nr:hypothetical protein QJ852_18270 [Nocardioides sp. L-11A]